MGRYAVSRQKVCEQCSFAKARCDRKQSCSRCRQRSLNCVYKLSNSEAESRSLEPTFDGTNRTPYPQHLGYAFSPPDHSGASLDNTRSLSSHTSPRGADFGVANAISSTLDFQTLHLTCPINADEISNRWLNPFVPGSDQSIKNYPPNISALIYNTLKSYAGTSVGGRRPPPFVHCMQMVTTPTPLSTCLSLIRIFEKPIAGSEDALAKVLQTEMANINRSQRTYDDFNILGAFQAYLIYAMVLFFRGNPDPIFLRQAMMNLQDIACESSRRGLVCTTDEQDLSLLWESWIFAESNRRTLYTMYLFDSALSAQDGMPTYLGTELRGLPAPMDQMLWEARDRHTFAKCFRLHQADWMEGSFQIDELWPIPADFDQYATVKRRKRTDQWLEDVDAYGMMLFAVTSCTHGG